MKRIFSIILTLAMLLSTCAIFASVTPVAAVETTLGDLNNDGKINSIDSLLLRKYIASVQTHSINVAAADLNGDTRITAKDTILMKQYLSGAITAFDGSVLDMPVDELLIAGEDISKFEVVVLSSTPEGYSLAFLG